MEKYDWMQAIKTNILILKIVGLWPDSEDYKFDFYALHASVWLSTLLVASTFFQGINIIFILDDVKALTGTAYVLLTEILAVIKTYFVVKNMKMLKHLMQSLNNNKLFQPRSHEQIKLIQPSLKFWKLLYNLFHSLVGGATLFWILFPIVDKKEKRLPFLGWYIVDTKVSPYYEIVYGFQFCSCCYMSALIINIDTLIAALNVYIGNQIDILCNNLRNLKAGCSIERDLITCIKHHQEILK
uniref:Olfactory receptor 21 n=1 Tax=Tribolium castaneum TaxID=7070 RepID=C0Z3R8_TRICA|nr:olfactory receptor 21 [Tribolium castaneum]